MLLPRTSKQCVIILVEYNNGVAGDTSTPINRKKSFQSFL